MSLKKKLFGHSSVYVLGSFFEQGAAMVLLPLYMHKLTPEEYGIVGYCRDIGGFAALVLGLGLHGAAARLYFDYRDNPRNLKEFWGTVFVSVFIFSMGVGFVLAFFGESLFDPILGGIPFKPFVTLTLVTASLTPFMTTYLYILQTRHQSLRFALLNSTRFVLSLFLIVYLVVWKEWGALGPLAGYTIAAALYQVVALVLIREDIKVCFRWRYFKEALLFSLPILPSVISTRISVIADRVIMNNLLGQGPVGLYKAGYQMGYPLSVIGIAVNSAFSPIFQDAMKTEDREKLNEIKRIGLFLVFGYCMLGTTLALVSREIIWFLGSEQYERAAIVIPFIAYYFSLQGIYYLFVSPLKYYRKTLWYSFWISSAGMILNVLLNFWLIPKPSLGIVGACLAALSSQSLVTILTAVVGDRYTKVPWQYARYGSLFAISACVGIGVNYLPLEVGKTTALMKMAILIALVFILSLVGWGDPLYIIRRGKLEWRRFTQRGRSAPEGSPAPYEGENLDA